MFGKLVELYHSFIYTG